MHPDLIAEHARLVTADRLQRSTIAPSLRAAGRPSLGRRTLAVMAAVSGFAVAGCFATAASSAPAGAAADPTAGHSTSSGSVAAEATRAGAPAPRRPYVYMIGAH